MQKISLILFLVIFITGCLAIKNQDSTNSLFSDALEEKKILEEVKNNNISKESYYIQKAVVEIITEEGRKTILANLKYEKPDKYLFSVKSRTGIEVSRIFITDDTILVNDRINRKVYYGSSSFFKMKYGIPVSVLPVMLGDYIQGDYLENGLGKFSYGKMTIDCKISGINIEYLIDSRKGKTITVISGDSIDYKRFNIQYKNFKNNGLTIFPGTIMINDLGKNISINIKILKFQPLWNGKIDFIPGNKYEISKLQ